MAFVPKIHNRYMPVANTPTSNRSQQEAHARHLRSLHEMSPRVTTHWGSTWNGLREQKQPGYAHVRTDLKRQEISNSRLAEIELENQVLLQKLSKVVRRSETGSPRPKDWMGGLRLTSNQVPVIDHWMTPTPANTKFGASVEHPSLNSARRRQELEKIDSENRTIVSRLYMTRPTYNVPRFEVEARDRKRWLESHAMVPGPREPPLPPLSNPAHLYAPRPATVATMQVTTTDKVADKAVEDKPPPKPEDGPHSPPPPPSKPDPVEEKETAMVDAPVVTPVAPADDASTPAEPSAAAEDAVKTEAEVVAPDAAKEDGEGEAAAEPAVELASPGAEIAPIKAKDEAEAAVEPAAEPEPLPAAEAEDEPLPAAEAEPEPLPAAETGDEPFPAAEAEDEPLPAAEAES